MTKIHTPLKTLGKKTVTISKLQKKKQRIFVFCIWKYFWRYCRTVIDGWLVCPGCISKIKVLDIIVFWKLWYLLVMLATAHFLHSTSKLHVLIYISSTTCSESSKRTNQTRCVSALSAICLYFSLCLIWEETYMVKSLDTTSCFLSNITHSQSHSGSHICITEATERKKAKHFMSNRWTTATSKGSSDLCHIVLTRINKWLRFSSK